MPTKQISLLLFLLISVTAFTQNNFSYTPEHPRAGDLITITYEPAGALAGVLKKPEAAYYMLGNSESGSSVKNIGADELMLSREGKKFTATVPTDTAANFIYFSFSSDGQFDNNFNNGYYIVLTDGNNPKKGGHYALTLFYQFLGRSAGVDPDNAKALDAFEKEMALYPGDRKKNLLQYYRLVTASKQPNAHELIQKEIESTLKAGLLTEEDYQTVESLYSLLKLPEQSKMIASIKKEKFPKGKWTVSEAVQKMYAEQDPAKFEAMLDDIAQKVQTDPDWKQLETSVPFYRQQVVSRYQAKKNWEGMKSAIAKIKFGSDEEKASFYNNLAWNLQKANAELKTAEELSRFATQYTRKQMEKPTGTKPAHLTTRQWNEQRRAMYAMYADTYGMVMYRLGEYKKGLPYAKDAAITIGEGKSPDENNTYALLAEKALPAKQYKKDLEQFVKDGKATSEIKDILKRAYVKDKGSDKGFDDYIVALETEAYNKMMEELRKSMLNEASPSFALMDLDGNKINIADLKGKVVVVDFWATWCGPCKASFPAMQKMVNRFKENPDVKFVFIDTWENVDEKQKNASEFINTNKYTFHVLLDNDSKVVEQFKVEGIPTKFVIDKNGVIRFKSVGFDGSDDKLVSELTAMIDMAAKQGSEAKTF